MKVPSDESPDIIVEDAQLLYYVPDLPFYNFDYWPNDSLPVQVLVSIGGQGVNWLNQY